MYSNMKYYENICNCLRVIQQDINRKLKSANCWQRTSLKQLFSELMHDKANKPIGVVFANAFAYAALTLFYIANFVTKQEKDRKDYVH